MIDIKDMGQCDPALRRAIDGLVAKIEAAKIEGFLLGREAAARDRDGLSGARLDAVTALEIAAELPSAQRCQAFIRAFIAEQPWAVQDVANRRRDAVRASNSPGL